MANTKNVQSMTPEELAAYVEVVRQRNAANAKKYYNEKIKTDPEKYHKFLVKCKEPNRKYYHSKMIEPVIINEPYIKTPCDLFTDSIHSP